MLTSKQQENYKFFSEHIKDYLNDPILKNKFVIICDGQIKSAYDSFESAYEAACTQFPMEEFIVQQIIDESETIEFIRSAVV